MNTICRVLYFIGSFAASLFLIEQASPMQRVFNPWYTFHNQHNFFYRSMDG